MASAFPIGGTREGRTVGYSEKELKEGLYYGALDIGRGIPHLFDKALDLVDRYVVSWVKPFKDKRKPQLKEPPGEKGAAPGAAGGTAGFSRDYRDIDTIGGEFGYASIKREAERRGYRVVEMPDLRMQSIFGNIGYERDNDIYIAMSKARTAEGVEVIAHELKAKELQRRTGNYNHEDFHPVIEPLQGRAAREIISGRDARETITDYLGKALRDLRMAA